MIIDRGYIKIERKPGDLFLQFFKYRKIAKVKDLDVCKKMVEAYNKTEAK